MTVRFRPPPRQRPRHGHVDFLVACLCWIDVLESLLVFFVIIIVVDDRSRCRIVPAFRRRRRFRVALSFVFHAFGRSIDVVIVILEIFIVLRVVVIADVLFFVLRAFVVIETAENVLDLIRFERRFDLDATFLAERRSRTSSWLEFRR